MSDDKSLTKITTKYQCMVTGQKQMAPCAGCIDPKACVSSAMQYKENEEMDSESKAVVKINADGGVMKCAKGLASGDCGYKAGAKVCGKCGAMAVESKMDEEDDMMPEDEEMMPEEEMEEGMKKGKRRVMKMKANMPNMAMGDDEDEEDEEMPEGEEEEEDEDAMEEEDMRPSPAPRRMMASPAPMEEEEAAPTDNMAAMRQRMRAQRMQSMGMKSADFDSDAYICAFERKMHPGGANVCQNCPGGCAPEGSMPGLLEVEGMAEETFGGKVLDSGYSDAADMFVLDLERKDGRMIEAYFEGSTGECLGWHMIDNQMMAQKSAFIENNRVVSFLEAADIATKSIAGHVMGVEPDVFEGFESYAVEIEAIDGKSYDVYVSLDGEVLGYDEYSQEEADEIEAEAAEIALKRAYSEEMRNQMAESGQALPDGSYPIKDEADLRNAIQAFGRAKDKNKAKAHIIKRAMDLGKEDLIPENWVPKKIQEEAKRGEKSASDDEFLASLMEFEMLTAEEDLKNEN